MGIQIFYFFQILCISFVGQTMRMIHKDDDDDDDDDNKDDDISDESD